MYLVGAVATLAPTTMLGRFRAGGRARGLQRLLCWLGYHTITHHKPDEIDGNTDPCRHEWRCSRCGWLARAISIHAYVPVSEKDQDCRWTATCKKCGDESYFSSHRTRLVLAAEIPDAERFRIIPLRWNLHPCDYVDVCQDCDYQSIARKTMHDWYLADGNSRCSRCGEFNNKEVSDDESEA